MKQYQVTITYARNMGTELLTVWADNPIDAASRANTISVERYGNTRKISSMAVSQVKEKQPEKTKETNET